MDYKVIWCLLLSFYLSSAEESWTERAITVVNQTENEDIRFAGAIDGKAFFAIKNREFHMNWFEASEACERLNMTLAEIRTPEQADLIKSFTTSGKIQSNFYWVAGRDSWEPQQFKWKNSCANVALTGLRVLKDNDYPRQPMTCLLLHSGRRVLYFFECNNVWESRLCEVSSQTCFQK